MELNDDYKKKIIAAAMSDLGDNELPLDKLVPRLKIVESSEAPTSVTAQYDGKTYHLDAQQQLICEPFIDDIWLFYAIDRGLHFEFLQERHLQKQDLIELPDLRDIAITNMIPEVEERFSVHGTEEGFYAVTCGGNYEAALLLLPGLWQQIEEQLGDDLWVAIPNRDICLFVHSNDLDAINNLKIVVHQAYTGGNYPLSRKLFKRKGDEWLVADSL